MLALAQQGDEAALGALLESFRNYLSLLARMEVGRQLQTKVDVADIVQETFLEAHRSLPSFRGSTEAEFVAWLRAVMANRIANLTRHYLGTQRRDIRREQTIEANLNQSSAMLDVGLFADQSTPSQHVAKREQGVLLAEALAKLPSDYRETIILRHLEELSFPEVAQRMNRSVDSVQKLWVRGLAQLRQVMKGVE